MHQSFLKDKVPAPSVQTYSAQRQPLETFHRNIDSPDTGSTLVTTFTHNMTNPSTNTRQMWLRCNIEIMSAPLFVARIDAAFQVFFWSSFFAGPSSVGGPLLNMPSTERIKHSQYSMHARRTSPNPPNLSNVRHGNLEGNYLIGPIAPGQTDGIYCDVAFRVTTFSTNILDDSFVGPWDIRSTLIPYLTSE